jgi:protein SCO1/2
LSNKIILFLKHADFQSNAGSEFIQTNNFVLVNGQGRIRGYYYGTNPKEVTTLIADIKRLEEE